MKIKLILNGVLVGLVISLTGCATPSDVKEMFEPGSVVSTESVKKPPTEASNVKLYYGNDHLPKKYRVIGHASADHFSYGIVMHSESTIAEELKKQAAKIGGRGVINIKTGADRTTGDVIC